MTDKDCKRAGYDSTGRYHIPSVKSVWDTFRKETNDADEDQCPDCRTPPGEEHAKDCEYHFVPAHPLEEMAEDCSDHFPPEVACGVDLNPRIEVEEIVHIPLAVQAWIFAEMADNAYLVIDRMVEDFWEEIINVAQGRLREGYESYGSAMFTWSAGRRRQELIEELADAVVYAVSGPIE